MDFGFVRKLTRQLPEEQTEAVVGMLLAHGIEVYAKTAGGGDDGQEGAYVSADAHTCFSDGDIYVPAADRERAAELLEQAGALAYLCSDPAEALEMTEEERLQADMLRRHRRNMAICLVVIVLAALYYAFF